MENVAKEACSTMEGEVLIVDLDGTLLRSDMLFETFWDSLARDWKHSIGSVVAAFQGLAPLKRHLQQSSQVDVSTLPYNQNVIDYIESWRTNTIGGRTALVTASDVHIATEISEHLGIFDEVYGSDGEVNLKGAEKSHFLSEKYGAGAYTYMGDSAADIPVWESAERAITVDASSETRRKAESLGVSVEHIDSECTSGLNAYIKGLRPHQWLKNTLIFIPLLAAHNVDSTGIGQALLAFCAFSIIASSVYLFNDLLDLSADRKHVRKRFRPLASGNLPIAHGTVLAMVLLVFGLGLSALLSTAFLNIIIIYFLITTAYSMYLKRIVVIDLVTLSALYTIRVIAGGVATGTSISIWLLAFSGFFFLSLAAVKRQAELLDNQSRGKKLAVGRGYHTEDLALISQLSISAGYVSVLVMVLYAQSPDVAQLYHQPIALFGPCIVLMYWITRISMITHRGDMHDDPIVFAAKDKVSYGCLAVITGFAAVAISD